MTTSLATPPKLQFFDLNGAPLSGGKLYTYVAGTTTPQASYTDYGGATANTNPVILDSRGEASVWLDTPLYKMALYDSTNVLIWTVDNIGGFATLAQLAASGGSALVGYLPAGTGAVATTVQTKLQESVSVKDFGAKGDGTTDDTTAIQAAINAVAVAGGVLYFPPGTYKHVTQLVFKNNIEYRGSGYQSCRLNYTGTSDGVVIQNPINSSTLANIYISGIYFNGANITGSKGNLFDTGSSLVTVERCFFYSPTIGLILDQSELWSIRDCYFASTTAGAWLVNGADRNAEAANPFYTNRIKFDSCQFNTAGIGVADDGGNIHEYQSCNFNTCSNWIRATAVYGLLLTGGEYELSTASGLSFVATKWKSGIASLPCEEVQVSGAFFFSNLSQYTFDIATSSLSQLSITACTFFTSFTVHNGINNCTSVFSEGNRQLGAGTAEIGINNYYDAQSYAASWGAASVAPAIGNGTIVGSYSRKGKEVTFRGKLTAGSTTTFGTGSWSFSLPVAHSATSGQGDVGSVLMTAGLYYVGAAKWDGSVSFNAYAHGAAVQVNSASPAAWANGNTFEWQITYPAANNLG